MSFYFRHCKVVNISGGSITVFDNILGAGQCWDIPDSERYRVACDDDFETLIQDQKVKLVEDETEYTAVDDMLDLLRNYSPGADFT